MIVYSLQFLLTSHIRSMTYQFQYMDNGKFSVSEDTVRNGMLIMPQAQFKKIIWVVYSTLYLDLLTFIGLEANSLDNFCMTSLLVLLVYRLL